MADFNLIDLEAIRDVVSGWTEKINAPSSELTKLVPYVELFAILDEKTSSSVANRNLDSEALDVTLIDATERRKCRVLRLFSLLEQQTSVDASNRLTNTRGVGGIDSLNVAIQQVESGAYTVHMRIIIPTFEKEILSNLALRKLIIPGTEWVIMYGWFREGLAYPTLTTFSDNQIDLNKTHHGYFKVLKATLINFNWNLEDNKILIGDLIFGSPIANALASTTIKNNRKNLKSLLITKQNELMKNCPEELKKQLPKQITKKVKRKIPTDHKTNKTSEIDGYYYLGWVVEALRQSLESDDNAQFFKTASYAPFKPPKKLTINFDHDNESESTTIDVLSPAEILLNINSVNANILDGEQNDSFFTAINEIIKLANTLWHGTINIVSNISPDGTSLRIAELNESLVEIENETDLMPLYVSAENSLVQSVSFSGRVPREASFGIDFLINDDYGATQVFNLFQEEARSNRPDDDPDLSTVALLIRQFQRKNMGKDETLESSGKLSMWKDYLQSDGKLREKIYNNVLSNSEVPIGLALRNYFSNLTIVIHGTAAIPSWTNIDFRGFFPGVDGQYTIYQINDQVTPKDFTTSIEAKLLKPYQY